MGLQIMAVYTEELNTNYNFPNIYIYNRYKDGVLSSYRAYPYDGYVMYSQSEVDTYPVMDENGNISYVTPYCTMVGLSLRTNFDNFDYVAVLRSEVNENYIFGGGEDNDHEVM